MKYNANLEITLNTYTVFDWIAVNEVSSSSHLTKRLARYLNNVNSTAVVSLIFIFANGFTCRYIQCTDVRFADNLAARFLIRETIRRAEESNREKSWEAWMRLLSETPCIQARSMLISMVVAHCAITSTESLSRSVKSFIDDFATIYANATRHGVEPWIFKQQPLCYPYN